MPRKTSQFDQVILTLPSKGELESSTLDFLTGCGLKVIKTNPRQYSAHIPTLPQVAVLFQRTQDIVAKVAEGNADLGITGLDIVLEYGEESRNLMILREDLNYGHCDLVVAVPESWIDVDSLSDIADIALDFRDRKGRDLRIATKFPNLVRKFLYENGIAYFAIVAAQGAIEAAPALGYADIIADLTTTGTTLRENHLRPVENGAVLHSQACFIGNKRSLLEKAAVLHAAETFLEIIDAAIEGKQYYLITANIQGASTDEIAQHVVKKEIISGLQGPTITPVYSLDRSGARQKGWYAVTITVRRTDLLKAVAHLRSIHGSHVVVTPVHYVFFEKPISYHKLLARLKREKSRHEWCDVAHER